MDKQFNHMWAVTAHGESPYLEKCVYSIMNQTVKSKIKIFTATDNALIRRTAQKYGIEVAVKNGDDIVRYNWNFAYNHSDADWITIAHQDDIYRRDYVENLEKMVKGENDATLFFSDYIPFGGNSRGTFRNRNIQRIIKFPMKFRICSNKAFWKKFILSMGNAVCTPTVSYNKSILGGDIYLLGDNDAVKNNIDWEAFYIIAGKEGRFLYCDKPLLKYRIHSGSETNGYMANGEREKEDAYMLQQFWPKWTASILMHFYKKCYEIY